MPPKHDPDSSPGVKVLRLFRKLMLEGKRHFQTDLAEEFQCSPQSIMRMMADIEAVVGINLESGLERRRRWYQIRTISRNCLGLDFEELRYLSICRDLATSTLPEPVAKRVDDTILNLSVLMADQDYALRDKLQQPQLSFFSKGRIDYTPHLQHIEALNKAIEGKLACLVQYRASGKTESKEHRFAPARIVSMSGALYVLGAGLTENFSEQRHLTNLAIHRIHDVVLLDRRHRLNLPETDPQAFGLPWHEPRTFAITFKAGKAAEYVRERTWADQQRMEDLENGDLLLEITTRSEPELMAWVRSFGEEADLQNLA